MTREFDDVRMKIRKDTDAQSSLNALLKDIAQKFDSKADDPRAVREMAAELNSNADRIVSDVHSGGNETDVDVSDAEKAMRGPTTPKNAASKAQASQHTR